jgi:hypothetical protein
MDNGSPGLICSPRAMTISAMLAAFTMGISEVKSIALLPTVPETSASPPASFRRGVFKAVCKGRAYPSE